MGSGHAPGTPELSALTNSARGDSHVPETGLAAHLPGSLTIVGAFHVGHPGSPVEKFPYVACCKFGKRMPASIGTRLDHGCTLLDLFDLFIARLGQEAENYVFECYEANAHLNQLGMIGLRDLPAAIIVDCAHDCFSDGSARAMMFPIRPYRPLSKR
tara:strand:- start:232 stop:702 length:471 start_codon:yes stop_codon:yes gene_type:complete